MRIEIIKQFTKSLISVKYFFNFNFLSGVFVVTYFFFPTNILGKMHKYLLRLEISDTP